MKDILICKENAEFIFRNRLQKLIKNEKYKIVNSFWTTETFPKFVFVVKSELSNKNKEHVIGWFQKWEMQKYFLTELQIRKLKLEKLDEKNRRRII